MATLTSGQTKSLNSLGAATGVAAGPRALSAAKGDSIGPIAMSSFAIDSVGSVTGYTYAVESTSESYTLGFGGAGSNFGRISGRAANFTWSVPAGSYITLGTNSGTTATFSVSSMNPQGVGAQSVLQTIQTHTIRAIFADGYNTHATGYNTSKDKTVYSVDSYDGNSVALCLTSDSPITMADGSIKEVGQIEEGDKLKGFSLNGLSIDSDGTFYDWSTSELNKTEKEVTVVNVIYSFTGKYYNINNGEITATSEHPLLVKDSTDNLYKFKQMFNLNIGDKLIKFVSGNTQEIDITSITIDEETSEIVSLDVEAEDTYLVNGYITHNKGNNAFTDLGAPGAPTSLAYASPSLSWVAPTATGTGGITAYDIQISSGNTFATNIVDNTEWSTTTIEVNTLLTAGTWYARVRAIDQGLKGAWTSAYSFVR
jgi:hypothetical protein